MIWQIHRQPCDNCRGMGKNKDLKLLQAENSRAAWKQDHVCAWRGEGEAGDHGDLNGDLYVFLHVEEHEFSQIWQ